MVDPQPGDAGVDPGRDQGMGGLQHRGVLHPHAGQGGHGEEAAVVQLGVAPRVVHQLVVLPGVHRRRVRPVGRGARSQRKPVLEVTQLAVDDLQRRVVTEHRHQDPAPAPVDVEPVRVRRRRPVLQHVPPGRVLRRHRDAQVVGHQVDHHVEPGLPGGGQHGVQSLLAAPVVVDAANVGGVVAVHRAAGGLQDRGEVDRTDPQRGQVVDLPRGVVQREVPAELQAVRRGGHRHARPYGIEGRRRASEAPRWRSENDEQHAFRSAECAAPPLGATVRDGTRLRS